MYRLAGMASGPLVLRVLLCFFWACPAVARHLQRLVVVGRHSIWNPYPSSGEAFLPGVASKPLSAYTSRSMPSFPSLPGQLTPKGRTLMRRLGAFYREHYREFLAQVGCDRAAVFADPNAQGRAADSAEAFVGELLGATGCTTQPLNKGLSQRQVNALFRRVPGGSGASRECGTPGRQALAALLGVQPGQATATMPTSLLTVYRRQLGIVQERTNCCEQSACVSQSPGLCTLFGLPLVLDPNATNHAVGGPLGVAAAFAEIFQTQFCEGLEAGWGLSGGDMVELLSLLEVPFHETGVNDVTARNLGSELMASVLEALAPAQAAAAPSLVLYFGHDTNLQFLRRMLRLTWLSEGWWPNVAEPGGQLVFEVYNEGVDSSEDQFTVRVLKVAASPEQQRMASPLNASAPPSVVPLWVPGCDDVFCPLTQLLAIGKAAIRPSCVGHVLANFALDRVASSSPAGPMATAHGATGVSVDTTESVVAPAEKPASLPVSTVMAPASSEQLPASPMATAEAAASGQPSEAELVSELVPPSGGGHPLLLVLSAVGLVACLCHRRARASARGYEALGGRTLGAPGISL